MILTSVEVLFTFVWLFTMYAAANCGYTVVSKLPAYSVIALTFLPVVLLFLALKGLYSNRSSGERKPSAAAIIVTGLTLIGMSIVLFDLYVSQRFMS